MQVALWFAGGNIVCRVEGREIFADDFFRGITFDFLRACIPSDHIAVGIQHVNGVLLDAIHQNLELFGLVQCSASEPFLGHWLRRQFSHTDSNFPSELVPPALKQFYWKST